MNNASVDILQACTTIAGSLTEIAMMVPVYATIWTLAWIASEQCPSPVASRP
jgi:hypothetical protein